MLVTSSELLWADRLQCMSQRTSLKVTWGAVTDDGVVLEEDVTEEDNVDDNDVHADDE